MKNCIILGNGRSGTSMAAGALITANPEYNSSVGEMVAPRLSNPDGVFEPVTIRSINESILSQVVPERPVPTENRQHLNIPKDGQRWLARIPVEVDISKLTKTVEDRIKEQVRKTPFCFKDPRFSYTLEAWRPYLENCVFICMFRHPAETAESIVRFSKESERMKDFEISYDQALEVWAMYNQHILEKHYPAGGKWLFLHMDQLFTDEGMNHLAEITGAQLNRSLINKNHVRTRSSQKIPNHIQAIYDTLCKLADYKAE